MAGGESLKRKQPPSGQSREGGAAKDAKRVKLGSARAILAQPVDRALDRNGELDVASFVAAREFEIRALEQSMRSSKQALASRAFQQVPRHMRRRTASHNVKKVPRRLQRRAAKEQKDDKTQTSKSNNKNKKKRIKGKEQKVEEVTGKEEVAAAAAAARDSEASKPEEGKPQITGSSRFKKRQVSKTWLPTHLFHAKRARMTPPLEPLWRFAIPLTPTEKSYRVTRRATRLRGCMAWDSSYTRTIAIEGGETDILDLLQALGLPKAQLYSDAGEPWRRGLCSWCGWMKEPGSSNVLWLAKVTILWHVSSSSERRVVWIRVHPSAFYQLREAILKEKKKRDLAIALEDLKFELGSIEIAGPQAAEALAWILEPVGTSQDQTSSLPDAEQLACLAEISNSTSLRAGYLLHLSTRDPRLGIPHHSRPVRESALRDAFILSAGDPNVALHAAPIFSHEARTKAIEKLPSQKAISRRRGNALPGSRVTPLPTDPEIPMLLLAQNHDRRSKSALGSWTLILPWKCVLSLWQCLMHVPLRGGMKPLFGGLIEQRQVCAESLRPWFPGDFPGTQAGWQWELQERDRRRKEWSKRPKGRRVEWESVDLGLGRKGEVGRGWACDWERLFGLQTLSPSDVATKGKGIDGASEDVSMAYASVDAGPAEAKTPPDPIHFVPLGSPCLADAPLCPHCLAPVSVELLGRGTVSECARIYRLPTSDETLRSAWLRLSTQSPPRARSRESASRRGATEPGATAAAVTAAANVTNDRLPAKASEAAGSKSCAKAADASGPFRAETTEQIPIPVPGEEDLVGFVTSGNYNLELGGPTGIGNVVLARLVQPQGAASKSSEATTLTARQVANRSGFCILRDSGMTVGRLARWKVVSN